YVIYWPAPVPTLHLYSRWQYTNFPKESKLKNLIVDRKGALLCRQRTVSAGRPLAEHGVGYFSSCLLLAADGAGMSSACVDSCVFIGPSHKKIKFFAFFCRST
ncbi:MAG: hypothetical protein ACYSYV_11340, partial [Planctomycetota bacterium]